MPVKCFEFSRRIRHDFSRISLGNAHFRALQSHQSHPQHISLSDAVQRTHRDPAVVVLRNSTVAHPGVAPDALDLQKRVLNGRPHRALALVLRFLLVTEWRIAIAPLVGEVARLRCVRVEQLSLMGVGAVSVQPCLLAVQ